jgi:hypothetical protein
MAINTQEYDVVYGRLLGKGLSVESAKSMASVLIDLSNTSQTPIDTLLQSVTVNGLVYSPEVYKAINKARTPSSQLGYADINSVPLMINQQMVIPESNG